MAHCAFGGLFRSQHLACKRDGGKEKVGKPDILMRGSEGRSSGKASRAPLKEKACKKK